MILVADKTLWPGSLRGLGLALAVLLGGIPRSHAQEPNGFSSIPVVLNPESRNEFQIDANPAITLTVQANRRDLRLFFKDPKGKVWKVAAPTSETGNILSQTVYRTTIERPAAGSWTLSASSSSPLLGDLITRLQIAYANQVHARMAIPRKTLVSGESLPVSLELMDGVNRVKNLRTTATVTKLVEPAIPPASLSFHDDRLRGDRIAKDGLYTTTILAKAPGRFRLEAQIEGIASTGRFHRTVEMTFKVVAKAARITGNINQRILVGTPE